MAYKLIQNFTKVNFTKGNSGRKYIVIHYTGNKTDKAVSNGNYFKSENRGASAHYFVDDTSVVQVVSEGDTAWAVGRNYGSIIYSENVRTAIPFPLKCVRQMEESQMLHIRTQ